MKKRFNKIDDKEKFKSKNYNLKNRHNIKKEIKLKKIEKPKSIEKNVNPIKWRNDIDKSVNIDSFFKVTKSIIIFLIKESLTKILPMVTYLMHIRIKYLFL